MKVNFLNLKNQLDVYRDEVVNYHHDIIEQTAFVAGKYVKKFEEDFSLYLDIPNVISVNNGTSALVLALKSLDIGQGDEVIVPVNTFIATAEAVSEVGATPVFVDIETTTYNIDPQKIESKLSNKSRAIIPVHLYGLPASLEEIQRIAKAHNLFVIEDASQAHGAIYKGKKVGTIGDIGTFSFYPGKNLGAWGEAGAVVTSNKMWADKMRLILNHGSEQKYQHEIVGNNFRMDELQAAVLIAKLKHLDKWNEMRQINAQIYQQEFANSNDVIIPHTVSDRTHVWHIYSIRTKKRDQLMNLLKSKHIDTQIHYPTPLHLTRAYEHLGFSKGSFPAAEQVQQQILSLPMYPELPHDSVRFVTESIMQFFSKL